MARWAPSKAVTWDCLTALVTEGLQQQGVVDYRYPPLHRVLGIPSTAWRQLRERGRYGNLSDKQDFYRKWTLLVFSPKANGPAVPNGLRPLVLRPNDIPSFVDALTELADDPWSYLNAADARWIDRAQMARVRSMLEALYAEARCGGCSSPFVWLVNGDGGDWGRKLISPFDPELRVQLDWDRNLEVPMKPRKAVTQP